jgi:hypothetical protein
MPIAGSAAFPEPLAEKGLSRGLLAEATPTLGQVRPFLLRPAMHKAVFLPKTDLIVASADHA